MPFFGGWVVTAIVQKHAWEHGCDSYPMYVILDGTAYNSPQTTKNVAYFYEQGHSDAMYTYELSNPDDGDIWTFHLREFDSEQSTIPIDLYPTLQLVQYDLVNETVTANCTTSTTSTACLSGTFDTGSPLYLNLTSSVPLNNTSNATALPQTTTALRSQDAHWSYRDQPPALILRELNGDSLGQTVLKTTVAKVSDCTELKVCLSGTGAQPIVGAEVMTPLGLMLMQQADYASYCTDSSD
ncbi:hypothetical protein EIP86_005689 [Pleurotus ostreatoroseus]|nr:hypothetical protein EIP86_005689 [Pleurotus ostreatoroseus]